MPDTHSPSLARDRLLRVLALPSDATPEEIRSAGERLARRLQTRLSSAPPAQAAERRAEIAALEASVQHWTSGAALESTRRRGARRDRWSLLGALCGFLVMLSILVAYAAGFRIVRLEPAGARVPMVEAMATLQLDGRLPGATLHILDADRAEVFHVTRAEGAKVELVPGRYAIEVRREDCPDRWTRSVYFEPGATRRFEPTLCLGEGRLTVRSNVTQDRLQIDGLDIGPTGPRAHTVGVGEHTIRVEKSGYTAFEGRVRVGPDEELELHAELQPSTGPSASASAGSAAPVGRPIPVTKSAPSEPPIGSVRPLPFDVAELQNRLGVEDLQLPRRRFLLHEGIEDLTESGSTAWHDRVSKQMLERYDTDGSGRIDRLEESEAISCPVWMEIERDFDRAGLGLSMARYFGFDGSEWHPGALGFARAHRTAAYAKMRECGLDE